MKKEVKERKKGETQKGVREYKTGSTGVGDKRV